MAERLTILQIIPELDTGGAELSTIEIAEAVVRAGGRMLVATQGGRLSSRITDAGGELVPFPAATKNPARIVANGLVLAKLIEERRVSLIHARSRAPAWSALIAARRARVPFVTTYHGAYGENGALKRLYNSVMARADVVIANSRYTAELIRQRYRTPPSRITVIHRGVDLATFRPNAIAPERVTGLRAKWGAGGNQPIILHAARLTSWKGQTVLIDAAAELLRNGTLGNALVVLAGDAQGRDAYAQTLSDRARRLGLAERVRFAGHVDDMPAAYLAAHVTVVASIEPEAFGRAATEAQAMGCPVIATDIGAPPETILASPAAPGGSGTGWLVPAGDPQVLAARLADALALQPAQRHAMGQRAIDHVNAQFTLDAMKQATLAVYDRLLGTSLERAFVERK